MQSSKRSLSWAKVDGLDGKAGEKGCPDYIIRLMYVVTGYRPLIYPAARALRQPKVTVPF